MAEGNTPLVVAIFSAAAAGFFNILHAAYSQHAQRRIEREKAEAIDRLEREKAESTRILEMIKTGGIENAKMNLKFLVEVGLIRGGGWGNSIKDYLEKHPEGTPVLPSPGERFKFEDTDALTASNRELLQSSVNDYGRYLDHLGFSVPSQPKVRVAPVADMGEWASKYDPNTGEIMIASDMVENVDSPRREYTNHVLQHPADDPMDEDLYLIKSDLADYFVASYAYRPELNARTAVAKSLDNQTTFDAAQPALDAWRERREVWGGAFWAIRKALGPQLADQILAAAWMRMAEVSTERDTPAKFVAALMSAARDVASPEAEPVIAAILRQRKFPI